MPRKASPLKNWEVIDELPKRQVRGKAREACKELFDAFLGTGEKMMGTTLNEADMKRQLAQMRAAMKAMPEYGEKIKVGKSGSKLYMERKDL